MDLIQQTGIGYMVSNWVLLGLAATFAVAFALTAKSWREARRSPYYFQRKQALQQMQSYSIVSLVLMMATIAVVTYAWSPAILSTPRTALLTNAKPLNIAPARLTVSDNAIQAISDIARNTVAAIPTQFSQLTPDSPLSLESGLDNVIFASGINDNYEPVGVHAIFGEGDFTLYATFDYSQMDDGMTWAWVWRQNGELVSGGEQTWDYGSEGPGYVFLQPEEGFVEGDYSLELYVNGELQTTSEVEISASVANQ